MMLSKYIAPLVFFAGSLVSAQINATVFTNGTDTVSALLNTLWAEEYYSLVLSIVAVAENNTNFTEGILSALQASGNLTLLAPTNGAFVGVPANISSNTTELQEVLEYHILEGYYTAERVAAAAPGHTIAKTLLTGSYARLGSNLTQALVLFSNDTGGLEVAAPLKNITSRVASDFGDIHIIGLDEVLNLPLSLSQFAANATPELTTLATSVGIVAPLEAIEGLTIFLPNDAAVSNVSSIIASVNTSTAVTVLQNHFISGSVIYSTDIAANLSLTANSFAGESFTFSSSGNDTFVTSGNFTAKIVQADVIIQNGVAHVIDAVLLNTETTI
ncbi:FAS1 domain [Phaffia rhodozyma]|uniref:FAS1 domain n=1 Tax=Phaffia rhodozyma TaxID=264483 RepID=A0A0F7SST7_PHARH|nr:FAS1 domain [Phaffia rhodozyma]